MIEEAQKQDAGELLFFGVAVALWSTSALARTLTDAFNAAYEIAETRPGWKRSALTLAFGPVLAIVVIFSVGLMLIGPRIVERVAELVGLEDRKSTRLNSSHANISYAVFCLQQKRDAAYRARDRKSTRLNTSHT